MRRPRAGRSRRPLPRRLLHYHCAERLQQRLVGRVRRLLLRRTLLPCLRLNWRAQVDQNAGEVIRPLAKELFPLRSRGRPIRWASG